MWLRGALTWITVIAAAVASSAEQNLIDTSATLYSSDFDNELYHGLNRVFSSYPCFPQRIHLSQASDVVERDNQKHSVVNMTVSFSLDYNQCQNVYATVHYGRGNVTEGKATAEPIHFNYTSTVTLEFYESDLIYHVSLPELRGGSQRYWYRIQVDGVSSKDSTTKTSRQLKGKNLVSMSDSKTSAVSPTMSFVTPPVPGSPTSIALIGDLGQTEDSTVTMAHIYRAASPLLAHPISLVMFAGDLSYADGEPQRWIRWLDLMEPLFRTVPIQVAAGNHEIEYDNVTLVPFQFYENFFRNPNRLGPADRRPMSNIQGMSGELLGHYNFGNSFYASNHGLLHMITLSSFSKSAEGSVQHAWLKHHLRSIDRTVTPWIVVVFHAPLYTTFIGHVREPEAMTMKKSMEPLFVEYNVNLVVCGHDHGYMRTHPLAFGEVDTTGKAPIYLTVGAGGNREHHAPGYRQKVKEAWVAKRDRFEYGYGHLHVANKTHAFLNWVRDGYTEKGMQDSVWIINPHV